MERYAKVAQVLRTVFNSEDGLPADAARRLYLRTITGSPSLVGFEEELRAGLADATLSWKQMLRNDEYEVYDAETEAEAKAHAADLLLTPLEQR